MTKILVIHAKVAALYQKINGELAHVFEQLVTPNGGEELRVTVRKTAEGSGISDRKSS